MSTALSQIGATEEALAALSGAILQLAKQVLSYRYGPKAQLPQGRKIGTQSVTEVIWEGRNHALHWEEGAPHTATKTMLTALAEDHEKTFVPNRRYAREILEILGWLDATTAIKELQDIV